MNGLSARLGMPGVAGLAVLFAAFAFYLAALQPLEVQYSALRERVSGAPVAVADQAQRRVGTAAARLEAFYAFFGRRETATDYLAQLYALAQQGGLEPKTAEYQLRERRALRLSEYVVAMPLRGTYAQVRTFLESALAEIPVLTLDHVVIRRVRVSDVQVEAEVRFTIFLVRP